MCRIGGRLRSLGASLNGVTVEIPPLRLLVSNCGGFPLPRQSMAGSLTGAVAS